MSFAAATTRLLIACAALTLARPALAQQPLPKDAPRASVEARAKAFFQRAELNYRLRAFKKAIEDYQAALKLVHRPYILFNIAQCFRQLDELDKALFFYKLFLADWARLRPGTEPPNKAEVEAHVQQLGLAITARERRQQADAAAARQLAAERARLAAVASATARRGEARLRIEGLDTVLARVLIDGFHRATTPAPLPLRVKSGQLQVEVRAPGYEPWRRVVEVDAGKEAVLKVQLRRKRGSSFWLGAAIAGGVLALGSEALALVFTARAREHYDGTPSFKSARNAAIAGHVGAGVATAFALTSLFLHLRASERPVRLASAGLAPTRDGFLARAELRF